MFARPQPSHREAYPTPAPQGEQIFAFELPCSLRTFWLAFWAEDAYFRRFLAEKLQDVDISIDTWEHNADGGSGGSGKLGPGPTLSRRLEMSHPIKVSFPGTPSHARCHRTQMAKISRDETSAPRALSLVETQEVTGIPYSDYFSVETSWTVTEAKSDAPGATGTAVCMVTIHLQIHFCKSTWLKGTISANTTAESKESAQLWSDAALEWLQSHDHPTSAKGVCCSRDLACSPSPGRNPSP